MKRRELQNVTLVCIDCANPSAGLGAMRKSMEGLSFWRSILLTDSEIDGGDVEVVKIPRIGSREEYSFFMIRRLSHYFSTSHALVVQHDGHVINPGLWEPEFLEYDYIGAPWWYGDEYSVGNGGFSLRSKRLCKRLQSIIHHRFHPEDEVICRDLGRFLKGEGFKFAPEETAARFSHERNTRYPDFLNNTFGFHKGYIAGDPK